MSNEKVEPAPLHCALVTRAAAASRPAGTAGSAPSPTLGWSRRILGDDAGVAVGPLHAQRQRLERAAEHPARMRVELRADGAAQRLDRLHQSPSLPSAAPAMRSEWPPTYLVSE